MTKRDKRTTPLTTAQSKGTRAVKKAAGKVVVRTELRAGRGPQFGYN